MSIKADFYIPYAGGHLPMAIVSTMVTQSADVGDLQEVRMTIDAVSVGAPIFGDASEYPAPMRELGR